MNTLDRMSLSDKCYSIFTDWSLDLRDLYSLSHHVCCFELLTSDTN